MPSDEDDHGDGAGGPPWLPAVGQWLLAAGVLLLAPRLFVPAGAALVAGTAILLVAARKARG